MFLFVCVSLCMLLLYADIRKNQQLCYKNIAQINAADFMQIDEMDILIYIVSHSWTTIMPLIGAQSRFKRFSGQDVFLYARSFYSVIHFSYSLIIHCFNGKQLYYASKKLEYTRIVLIVVQLCYVYTATATRQRGYEYSFMYFQE